MTYPRIDQSLHTNVPWGIGCAYEPVKFLVLFLQTTTKHNSGSAPKNLIVQRTSCIGKGLESEWQTWEFVHLLKSIWKIFTVLEILDEYFADTGLCLYRFSWPRASRPEIVQISASAKPPSCHIKRKEIIVFKILLFQLKKMLKFAETIQVLSYFQFLFSRSIHTRTQMYCSNSCQGSWSFASLP